MMKWMIKNATIMTLDDEDSWIEDGDIVIEDGKIMALGHNLSPESFEVERVHQAKDRLVMPGLVNAHLHSMDRFDRGRFDNLPLDLWQALYNPPLGNRNWTPRECYLRTALNGIEMMKAGTTTVIDDVRHGTMNEENIEAVFQAYQDLGMRAFVSIGYSDKAYYKAIPYLEEILPSHLKEELDRSKVPIGDEVIKLWRKYGQRWRGRVGFVLSPSGTQRCTDDFLRKTWNLSEEMRLPVVVHVLETKVQAIAGRLFYGKSIVAHMKALNLLTPMTTLIHAVWLTDDDIGLISRAEASVVHNPVANLKLGSGVAPVRKFLDAGINVALGTDNNNANDTVNLFDTMKLAALLHKVVDFDYDRWIGAKEVVKMATRAGAHCVGLGGEIGTLSVGKRADLILLDLTKIPFFPRNNLLYQLVFCENGGSVDMVVVDGIPVVERGRMTTVNEDKILQETMNRANEIQDKIRTASQRGAELVPYLRQAYQRCIKEDIGFSRYLSP